LATETLQCFRAWSVEPRPERSSLNFS